MRMIGDMRASSWPIWIGFAGLILVATGMAFLDARAFVAPSWRTDHTAVLAPMMAGLRLALLVIGLGALWRLRMPTALSWRWAIGAAVAVLVCGALADVVWPGMHSDAPLDGDTAAGALDSLEQRLMRLAMMAAYAIPVLVLLAAAESRHHETPGGHGIGVRMGVLLVRWEPVLFLVGVSTLATTLAAAALLHTGIKWALPIGADTTLAACAAATVRARWRDDRIAFFGWSAVCISMAVGLLMGSYAFDGPLPAPAFIGGYDAAPRILLRGAHVFVMVVGIAAIAAALVTKPIERAR